MAGIDQNELLCQIADLAVACKTAGAAYLNASQSEPNPELGALYADYAEEMAHNVKELETEVHKLGGDAARIPDAPPAKLGVEASLKKAQALYDKAIDAGWHGEIYEILVRHFTLFEDAEEHLAMMKQIQAEKECNETANEGDLKPVPRAKETS